MKTKDFIYLIFCFSLIMLGCNEFPVPTDYALDKLSSSSLRVNGATQVSGIGYFDDTEFCDYEGVEQPAFAVKMTGDLDGCLFVFIDEYKCNSSGVYYEKGREHFIGTYKGEIGEFWNTYTFTAKYEGCAEDGSYLGLEIFGRCQHPIIKGSGIGVFTGVSGRLDLKDDIEAGNYPYRGHFKF